MIPYKLNKWEAEVNMQLSLWKTDDLHVNTMNDFQAEWIWDQEFWYLKGLIEWTKYAWFFEWDIPDPLDVVEVAIDTWHIILNVKTYVFNWYLYFATHIKHRTSWDEHVNVYKFDWTKFVFVEDSGEISWISYYRKNLANFWMYNLTTPKEIAEVVWLTITEVEEENWKANNWIKVDHSWFVPWSLVWWWLNITWKRFAITWNTTNTIYVQDLIDQTIWAWTTCDIYDVENIEKPFTWNYIQFKWKTISYLESTWKAWVVRWWYLWLFTPLTYWSGTIDFNSYNELDVWGWFNWIKEIDWKLMLFWTWSIKVLDFIWDYLWILDSFDTNNEEVFDIISYKWNIYYLTSTWIYDLWWGKLNKNLFLWNTYKKTFDIVWWKLFIQGIWVYFDWRIFGNISNDYLKTYYDIWFDNTEENGKFILHKTYNDNIKDIILFTWDDNWTLKSWILKYSHSSINRGNQNIYLWSNDLSIEWTISKFIIEWEWDREDIMLEYWDSDTSLWVEIPMSTFDHTDLPYWNKFFKIYEMASKYVRYNFLFRVKSLTWIVSKIFKISYI